MTKTGAGWGADRGAERHGARSGTERYAGGRMIAAVIARRPGRWPYSSTPAA